MVDRQAPDDGVVVDLVVEDGVVYLELANLASRPARDIACAFDPPLVDVRGRNVSKLRLFRRMPFLGPGRRVRTLLDSTAGWFARDTPPSVTVTVSYDRPGARRAETTVTHDLALYRELLSRA